MEKEEKQQAVLAQPQPPKDWYAAVRRIENVALVVARNPAAELFLRRVMLGDRDFDFMDPENQSHAYYRSRVAALRRRPSLLSHYWV